MIVRTARTGTPGGHCADWADQNTTQWGDTPALTTAPLSAAAKLYMKNSAQGEVRKDVSVPNRMPIWDYPNTDRGIPGLHGRPRPGSSGSWA